MQAFALAVFAVDVREACVCAGAPLCTQRPGVDSTTALHLII